MYCQECGAQLSNNSKFCSECGAQQQIKNTVIERDNIVSAEKMVELGVEHHDFADRVESVEDKETNDLLFTIYNRLIEPVRKIETLYVENQLMPIAIDDLKHKYNKKIIISCLIYPLRIWLVVFIITIMLIALSLAGSKMLCPDYEKLVNEYENSEELKNQYSDIGDFFNDYGGTYALFYGKMEDTQKDASTTIVIGIAALLGIIWEVVAVKSLFKKKRKKIDELNTLIDENEKEKDRINDAIKDLICYCPPSYRCSSALEFFAEAYRNTRVSTLKEAVNEYAKTRPQIKISDVLYAYTEKTLQRSDREYVLSALGALATIFVVSAYRDY